MHTLENKFIFSNQPGYRITRHLVFWGVWWLFLTIIYGNKPVAVNVNEILVIKVSMMVSATESLMYLPTHIVYSYAIIYYLIPVFLLRNKYMRLLVGVFVCTVLSAIFSYLI